MYTTHTIIKDVALRADAGSKFNSKQDLKTGYHCWVDTASPKKSSNGNIYLPAKRGESSGYVRANAIIPETKVISTFSGDRRHISAKVRGRVTYKVFNQKTYLDQVLYKHGCGYCVTATALSSVGKAYTPETLKKKLVSIAGSGKALSAFGIKKFCNSVGVKAEILQNKDKNKLKAELHLALTQGKPVAFCNASPHWLCLIGYDTKGKVVYVSSTNQAVRYATLDEIIRMGRTSDKAPTTVYWKDYNSGRPVVIG